jgi:hypothetical protein
LLPENVKISKRKYIIKKLAQYMQNPSKQKRKVMTTLTYNTTKNKSIKQILLAVVNYMKGLVYDRIVIKEEGKTRVILEKSNNGYLLFGCHITPESIKRRYAV